MANRISTELTNDASQFNQSMNNAGQTVEKFSGKVDDAKNSIKDLNKVGTLSTKDFLKEVGKLTGTEKNFTGYKRQLAQITKGIADLTVTYRGMSKEMQNSDIGRETLRRINELTQKASEYKDAIMDSQNAVKNLASDTSAWDGIKQGIDAASGALQTFVSAGVLGQKSTEKLVAVIAKLKAAEAATSGVIKIGNALQKDSAMMMAISTIQSKALTKAKELETVAQGKANIAAKAFNAIARANPYVLIISAVVAATAAIAAWTLATRKHNSETERAKKIQEGYNKAIKDGRIQAGDSIAKFQLLRTQYMNLRTEAEKTQWIENNKDKFSELGVELNNIADAQKWLVDNAADFIKALTLEAEAAALMSYYQEEYKKGIEESLKAQEKAENKKAGTISRKDIEKYGLKEGEDYTKTTIPGSTSPTGITTPPTYIYEWTAAGKEKMKKAGAEAGEAVLEGYSESLKPAAEMAATKLAQAEDLRKKSAPTPKKDTNNNKGGSNKEDKHAKEQEELMNKLHDAQMKLMQLKIQSLSIDKNDTAAVEASTAAIKEQEDAVESIKKSIDDKSAVINSELQLLKDYKKELESEKANIVDGSEEWRKQIEIINEVEKKIKDLEDAAEAYKKRINTPKLELVSPTSKIEVPVQVEFKGSLAGSFLTNDEKVELYKQAEDAASKIQEYFDLGLIGREQAQAFIDNINDSLANEKIDAKVSLNLDIDTKSLNEQIADAIRASVDRLDSIGSVANGVVGSFNSIYESIKNLGDAISDADNGWERFFALFSTGMTIFTSFTNIVESVATVLELLNTAKAASIPLLQQETNQIRSNTEETISNAAAKGVSAAAGAGESVSSVPYVGPVLAAAAIATILATIMSAIASAKGYATGGVVGGNSYSGDKILARLNSGELVLNQNQQNKLLYQLNNPSTRQPEAGNSNGKVEFKISGTELVGVLSNYQRKNSKI